MINENRINTIFELFFQSIIHFSDLISQLYSTLILGNNPQLTPQVNILLTSIDYNYNY